MLTEIANITAALTLDILWSKPHKSSSTVVRKRYKRTAWSPGPAHMTQQARINIKTNTIIRATGLVRVSYAKLKHRLFVCFPLTWKGLLKSGSAKGLLSKSDMMRMRCRCRKLRNKPLERASSTLTENPEPEPRPELSEPLHYESLWKMAGEEMTRAFQSSARDRRTDNTHDRTH